MMIISITYVKFHCLKCNCLIMSLIVKGNKIQTKRTKTKNNNKNNNNKEIFFNTEIACVSYVSIDILYIFFFCNVCIKKSNGKHFYNYYYYTLYL